MQAAFGNLKKQPAPSFLSTPCFQRQPKHLLAARTRVQAA
ncbi:hypothetical protein HMPREF9098_0181 [Kingella denitrificans ATCC 33394]|uniref:Uncharacterized protein n=1 Tax=Kingella denitrificans ATCC 33394 TaxID=888741 RepID=F0EWE7_9NEIS|nr:hypothetical protein HMPREF9098_0181 [Kingella denitrificans ATCC 33394]